MHILFGVFIGLIVLTTLVVLHELGHFFMAKKNGVKVNEFGIGFPPRAIAWIHLPAEKVPEYLASLPEDFRQKINSKKIESKLAKNKYCWLPFPKSEYKKPQEYLIFSLNYLPIGGFCAMDGESAADTKKGTFGATNFWQKTQILFGGVLMNWLTAIVVLTILAWTGMPTFLPHQFTIQHDAHAKSQPVTVSEVLKDSPAERAGIKARSKIKAMEVTGNKNTYLVALSPQTIIDFNDTNKNKDVTYYLVDENQNPYQVNAKLGSGEQNRPVLGVAMQSTGEQSLIHYTWSAPLVGLGTTLQITAETFKGLGAMVYNIFEGTVRQFSGNQSLKEAGKQQIEKVGDAVSGPVGIIGVLFPAFTNAGPTNLAFLSAIISVSLACMNVLPIPALDGGRWLLIGLFKLRHKKLSKRTEEKIVGGAFLALIGLSILITVLDIVKITK